MSLAILGISNSGLNLVVSLFALMLVVVWLALIVYTYLDAKRRISDPFLVACATIGSFIPYMGTAVYAIVRPPEFLEDAHERELEIKAAELRVRQLTELSCPNCEYPIEKTFLRCPSCQRRLKDPCPTCSKPVDPRWALCPYCETEFAKRSRRSSEKRREGAPESEAPPERSASEERSKRESRPDREERAPRSGRASREERPAPKRQPTRKKAAAAPKGEQAARSVAKEAANPKQPKRSPSREPDPDPRQA